MGVKAKTRGPGAQQLNVAAQGRIQRKSPSVYAYWACNGLRLPVLLAQLAAVACNSVADAVLPQVQWAERDIARLVLGQGKGCALRWSATPALTG